MLRAMPRSSGFREPVTGLRKENGSYARVIFLKMTLVACVREFTRGKPVIDCLTNMGPRFQKHLCICQCNTREWLKGYPGAR